MKPFVIGCVLAVLLLTVTDRTGLAATQQPGVTIGVVIDGPSAAYDDLLGYFRTAIEDLLEGDYAVAFPADGLRRGDWTLEGIRAELRTLYSDPDVDLVIALGVQASHAACCDEALPKPVLAPLVIDAQLQGFPETAGASGVRNLSYLTFPKTIQRDVQRFQEVVPFRRLTFVLNGPVIQAVPGVLGRTRAALAELGVEPSFVALDVGGKVESLLAAIPPDADAVYVFPLTQLDDHEVDSLAEALIERRLPSFALLGERDVERGFLMGLTPETQWERLARRVALYIRRIMEGEEPGSLPVAFRPDEQLAINMATARAIGVYPPWSALTEAVLLNVVRETVEREVTLYDAVREAVNANLDLQAGRRAVAAGQENVRIARSALLPQLDASASGLWIDRDRAEASFGAQPERSLVVGGGLSQVLLSEPALASLGIEKRLQESRQLDYEALRQQVIFAAAEVYLTLLKSKAAERIQRDNLRVVRSNRDRAEVRRSIGSGGPEEIYRWQAEIARSRQALIDASATRNRLEIELNRLLRRPLEERFLTREAGLEDPGVGFILEGLEPYLADPWSFRVLRHFLAGEARAVAPPLRSIDALVAAQQRLLSSRDRAFWIPQIGFTADLGYRAADGGAGSQSDPGATEIPVIVQDETQWSVVLGASLPLFTGTRRLAEKAQAREDLARLRVERDAAGDRVEGAVRSELHRAGASYANIRLSRDAADAARSNFELVSDSYGRGVLTILELLDAQNSLLAADLAAATAVYDFLIDLLAVERTVGRSSFFASEEELSRLIERLEAVYADTDPATTAP